MIGTFAGLNEGAVISNSSNAAVTIDTATASANITDNDTAIFTIDDVSVNEADGTATFTVSVDNPLDTDVMLDVSYAAGTAVAADFDGATETVTFAAGSTTVQAVTVAIISFWT